MAWPLASHFSAMLQNPRVAFRDPGLRQCVIEKNAQGQPRPWAGAFAVVYKATDRQGNNPFAVRIFTTESPERRERYAAVSEYLQSRRLSCLCDFEYRDDSIRSAGDGKWYPLILMEWVEGETLFKWARRRCLAGEGGAVARVAERWVALVRELNEASLAHGDLQHANVMVTPSDELKLVDYDCMCVPELVGRRNLEVGVDPYQHPSRNAKTLLSLDLDNFSALVIHAALKILAARPDFWEKYVEEAGHDKLLFRQEDLLRPKESSLYGELRSLADKEPRRLLEQLQELAQGPPDRVPSLGEVAGSYAKVEQLLKREQWGAAVSLLNQRGHFRDAPEQLKPLIRRAYEEVCRDRAWRAFRRIPEETSERRDRQLVDAWNEELFANFSPAEQQRIRLSDARRRVEAVDRVFHLVQQLGDEVSVEGEQRIINAADKLPQGYQHDMRERVETARRRVQAVGRMRRVLENPRMEASIVAAARAVKELTARNMLSMDERQRVKLAMRRVPLLRELNELSADLPRAERDRRLVAAWRGADWTDCPEADPWREEYTQAAARVEALGQLRRAAERGDSEQFAQLRSQGPLQDEQLPDDYAAAVADAERELARVENLEKALAEGNRSAFREHFDAGLIRRLPQRFGPYMDEIRAWTREEILHPKRLGLRKLTGWGSVTAEDDQAGRFRMRWHWPDPRYSTRCLLTISPDEPGEGDQPDAIGAYETTVIERAGYEKHGNQFRMSVQPEWIGAHVAVWSLIDVGGEAIRGRPVTLGRLKAASRWKVLSWGR